MTHRPIPLFRLFVVLLGATALGLMQLPGARAAGCIPNVDGLGHSAVVVNPTATFTGTVDATGCDFGVYVGTGQIANIRGATIFGADSSNIAVDGSANISFSTLTQSDMGVHVGVKGNSGANAVVFHNTIEYTDNGCGILADNGRATVSIVGNHITGPSSTVAEPIGIDVGPVVSATISNNTLTTNVDAIYLYTSGTFVVKDGNNLHDNQTGVVVDSTTNAQIIANRMDTGQTGVLDFGTDDRISRNVICNYTTPIDTSGATDPDVIGNRTNC
jgi:nitrous oxidase accessory protein NosD